MDVPRELIQEMLAEGEQHPYGLREIAAYLRVNGERVKTMARRLEWYTDQLEALSQEASHEATD